MRRGGFGVPKFYRVWGMAAAIRDSPGTTRRRVMCEADGDDRYRWEDAVHAPAAATRRQESIGDERTRLNDTTAAQ